MARSKQNQHENYRKPFAVRFRQLLEEKGVTMGAIADEIGISRQAVNNYALGETVPDANKLVILSTFFGVSSDYLLGLSDYRSSSLANATAADIGIPEILSAWLDSLKQGNPDFFNLVQLFFAESGFRDALLNIFLLGAEKPELSTENTSSEREILNQLASDTVLSNRVRNETNNRLTVCLRSEYVKLLAFNAQTEFYNAVLSAYNKHIQSLKDGE